MPPKPSRPQVLRREVIPAAAAALPPPPQTQPAPPRAGVVTETYSVNGVNYTTYTTFRSPITPDECESVSNRFFSENLDDSAETPTTPTNEGHFNQDHNNH